MTHGQKIHGLTLAKNSWIENLSLEQLVLDPSPVAANRVWVNSTEQVVKYSILDGQGAVVVKVIADAASLQPAIAALSASVAASVASLEQADAAELAAREAAVAALQAALDAEIVRAQAAEAQLTSDLAAEVARAQGAEQQLTTDLGAEVVRAQAAEQALGLRVDAIGNVFNYVATVEGGADAGSAFDLSTFTPENKEAGDYYKVAVAGFFKNGAEGVPFHANLNDGLVWNLLGEIDVIDNTNSEVTGSVNFIEVTGSTETGFVVDVADAFKDRVVGLETAVAGLSSQASADVSALQAALAQEVTDRTAGDAASTAAIAAEATRAQAAEAALSTAIGQEATDRAAAVTAEQTRAQTAESGLGAAIGQEVTDRTAAVAAVSAAVVQEAADRAAAVTAEQTRAVAAEAGLQSQIDALEAAAGEGAEALKTTLNGRIFNFKSAAPALSHVITHNLNTEFYSVQLMIKNAEGKFVNDIAPVAEDAVDPLNKLVVTLSEAADVKVSVESRSSIV